MMGVIGTMLLGDQPIGRAPEKRRFSDILEKMAVGLVLRRYGHSMPHSPYVPSMEVKSPTPLLLNS